MLDKDLADLYGVSTKRLNEQVRRNIKRFPEDFIIQLTKDEANSLKSLRSQFATLKRGQHFKYLPYAFTEQGVAMLSSVLNSKRAIQVNIGIMRVFVNIRKLVASNKKTIRDIIKSCENYIYWVDKYFSKVGLDWLSEINIDKVKSVKILMSSEKVDDE